MPEASYPRPLCAICGMSLRFVPEQNKWFCDTCKVFPEKVAPIKLKEERDLTRPAGMWIRVGIVLAIIIALALVRLFLI